MAAQFASVSELVILLSDQVHVRKDLRNLTLVNRRFHGIFSPLLWSTLEWNAENVGLWLDANKRCHYVQSKHMAHVTAIAYTYIDHERPDVFMYPRGEGKNLVGRVSNALADTVRHCVQLQSFEAYKLTVGNDLLEALAAQNSLIKLYLGFEDDMEYFLSLRSVALPRASTTAILEEYYGHPELHLGHFKNLQALTLRNIWGDMESWREGLVEVLLSNPQLVRLELGLDNKAKRRLMYEAAMTTVTLMCLVCEEYGARRASVNQSSRVENHIPLLRLRSLVLRNGLVFPNQYSLSQATDLTEMRYVYLYNDPNTVIFGVGGLSWVDWRVLSHEAMPNLRYIYFHTMDMDAWHLIPGLIRSRLKAAKEGSQNDLAAPSLRGIYAEEDGVSSARHEGPEAPSILDLCARTAPLPMVSLPVTLHTEDALSNLQHIQGGTWLTHLSFSCADSDLVAKGRDSPLMVWLREGLAPLVNLQALRIPFIGWPLPDDQDLDDIALFLAEACPVLGWVGLQDKSWRVRRGRGHEGESSPTSVTATRLEGREAEHETPEFFQGWILN